MCIYINNTLKFPLISTESAGVKHSSALSARDVINVHY